MKTLVAAIADPDYYPSWICAPCGYKYGRGLVAIASWHRNTCGICGRDTLVSEPLDFHHLRDGWREMAVKDAGAKS